MIELMEEFNFTRILNADARQLELELARLNEGAMIELGRMQVKSDMERAKWQAAGEGIGTVASYGAKYATKKGKP
jgi:hypothetical protein